MSAVGRLGRILCHITICAKGDEKVKKKDEFPGIYNLSPDDFVALMASAKQATGLSEQEIMDGLKELVD